jgi:putative hydrolase of the HAD superfamily
MNLYKHLFIDLDRTLWDFEANAFDTLQELYKKYNLNACTPDFDTFHTTYRTINRQLWKQYRDGIIAKRVLKYKRFYLTLKEFGMDDLELGKQLGEEYVTLSGEKTKLFPYTHEALSYLKEKYHLHIITNGFEEVQYKKIHNCNLDGYFEKIITSEKAGVQKPHQQIFEYALKEAHADKSASIMIGDDLDGDIRGAKSFGMDQVYFNPNHKEHNEKVTFEIESLKELTHIL